ncbi:MAG: S8 family serine peptidase [Armatimonadota bacterium]
MPVRHPIAPLLLAAALVPAALGPAPGSAQSERPARYIVELHSGPDGATEGALAPARVRATPVQVYSRTLRGFAADLLPQQVAALQRDPSVRRVWRDQPVSLSPAPRQLLSAAGKRKTKAKGQKVPTGVRRIGGLKSATAAIDGIDSPLDVDVAVIDTGVDLDHPDLNVVGGFSVFSGDADDPEGHGTHVAGTIGARDNRLGVVGVAPGARIWSVRVLNQQGQGSWSGVIAGLEWVAAHADTIEVANLSLGGPMSDDTPLRVAVDALVAAGVTVVAAAGNAGQDVSTWVPAKFESVLCVSALADKNGKAGKSAGVFKFGSRERDERFASFSNWGSEVDLIAPGVKILSTYKHGQYAWISGTSQAAPHAAGAAALYLARHPGATPAEVREALVNRAVVFSRRNDPDGVYEPCLDVAAL